MTPARTHANGLVNPSPLQPLLNAMLRMFAELVLHIASTLQMPRRRPSAECHSDATPAELPRDTSDIQKETQPAATSSQSQSALILRDREAIVSKDEGVLTPRATSTESVSASCRESRLLKQEESLVQPQPSHRSFRRKPESRVARTVAGNQASNFVALKSGFRQKERDAKPVSMVVVVVVEEEIRIF